MPREAPLLGGRALNRSLPRLRTYVREAWNSRHGEGPRPPILDLIRSAPAWLASFERPLELGVHARPWLTYGSIRALEKAVRRDWRVFEFGSGASTIFFGTRCDQVQSVEHDAEWCARVRSALQSLKIENVRLELVPPDDRPKAATFGSAFPGFEERTFQAYVRAIEPTPDRSMDLVVVDGRARPACLAAAMPKVKPGGLLILDNSERAHYRGAIETVPSSWRRRDFVGPAAQGEYFTTTTFWRAPDGEGRG